MSESSFSELVEAPEQGRVYALEMRPGLADCAPSGRLRLDALARWLQDVAYFDVEDAGLAGHAAWVVRRTRLHVRRFPRFGEHHRVSTFCSGMGRMWAERRTSIGRTDRDDADVEAVALWVHLDPETKRPVPLSDAESTAYGAAANGRRVTARLRHGTPPALAPSARWWFRATDCDVAAHVNNAAYWQPLEEELLRSDEPEQLDVELEFRTPAQPGEKLIVRDGNRRWIVSPAGETHATIVVANAQPNDGVG